MSIIKFVLITLGAGVLFSWAFWIGWGHRLHINVYSNGEFWYAEEFTEPGKIILTSIVGLVFGVCVSAVAWIIREKVRA
jgi:hypothetical protein